MSPKQLMIEMALALILATFAMSLDDVHATASEDAKGGQATCLQRLPALSEVTEKPDNRSLEDHSISDESQTCLSARDPAKANGKANDWLSLLP